MPQPYSPHPLHSSMAGSPSPWNRAWPYAGLRAPRSEGGARQRPWESAAHRRRRRERQRARLLVAVANAEWLLWRHHSWPQRWCDRERWGEADRHHDQPAGYRAEDVSVAVARRTKRVRFAKDPDEGLAVSASEANADEPQFGEVIEMLNKLHNTSIAEIRHEEAKACDSQSGVIDAGKNAIDAVMRNLSPEYGTLMQDPNAQIR